MPTPSSSPTAASLAATEPFAGLFLFRFVGIESEIGTARLTAFGQTVELDAESAHNCIMAQVGLVTEADFDAADFTDEEVSLHSDSDIIIRGDGDPVFMAKRVLVHADAVSYHSRYVTEAAAGKTFMSYAVTGKTRVTTIAPSAPSQSVSPLAPSDTVSGGTSQGN